MGKRIVIPEFRFNGKPWVAIPKQENDWFPGLDEHAAILVGIGMCEEYKYPQIRGGEGWRYPLRYYADCMGFVEEYTLTEDGLIIAPEYWNMEEIYMKCKQLFIDKYDLRKKAKRYYRE